MVAGAAIGRKADRGSTAGKMIMSKGNKQHGNREAKKPKADKKVVPVSSTFLKPQSETRIPGAKPTSK